MYKVLLTLLMLVSFISFTKEQHVTLPSYSVSAQAIMPNMVFAHYKGDRYKIITIARIEATLEEVVVYQLESNPELTWVRPVSLFTEDVLYNGTLVKRFTPVQ